MSTAAVLSKGKNGKRGVKVFRALLGVTAVALIGGVYWQQQLLHSRESLLPPNALHNALQQSRQRSKSQQNATTKLKRPQQEKEISKLTEKQETQVPKKEDPLPPAFQVVLERAKRNREACNALDLPNQPPPNMTLPHLKDPVVDLPNFGIIDALSNFSGSEACIAPPETECNQTRFTVIFMGYRPDRVSSLKQQVFSMTQSKGPWSNSVKEVILVWNGERSLDESQDGKLLLKLANERDNFRISFPLQEGFPNDLMNRYHPRLNVTTKGILFYDDDGPFYRYPAVLAGFELWKRNANAEIGAMARRIDLTKRQEDEHPELSDKNFHKQCRQKGDAAKYNFHEFANYHARMVLPSGSFLHSNYLCFLWHPALEEVRKFVRAHPVHPDDVTVSTIVSQVGGRAPKVYSRRLNGPVETTKRRRLQQEYPRRRLLWDDVSEAEWGSMRSMAVNSLASYFGSINSGSIGWCHDTPYQKQKGDYYYCDPLMANMGMLPWMTPDHKVKDTCP